MDLSKLTQTELLDLQKRIPVELKRREAKEKNSLLIEVKKIVEDRGFSLEDLLAKEGKTRSAVKVKYRHPENADLTWTGRGRTPKWVEQWHAAKGNLEGLLVS